MTAQLKNTRRFDELEAALDHTKTEYENAEKEMDDRSVRMHLIEQFMNALANQAQILTNFDEALWNVTVNEVLVKQSSELVIELKTGHMIFRNI